MQIKGPIKKIYGGGGGTIVLMIGLYLIILAFFILLNAISESSDSNYDQASNSLKNAFGFTSGEVAPTDEEVNITIEEFYSGIAQKLTGIVASYFPADSYDVTYDIGKIVVAIPTENLFDDETSTVNPMIYSFFFDTIRMLNNLAEGVTITVEASIQVKESPNSNAANNEGLNLAALRVSDMSEVIIQEASRFKELRSSVNLGKENIVYLYLDFSIADYQRALLSYRDYIQ